MVMKDSFFSEELYRSLVPPSHCNYGCFDDARKRRPNAHLIVLYLGAGQKNSPFTHSGIYTTRMNDYPVQPLPHLWVQRGSLGYIPPFYPQLSRYDVMSQSIINHEIVIIYLRVNLAMVLIGFESKNDDFRLNFRVTPISSRAKKDFRRVTFLCPGTAPANSLSLLIFLLVFISSFSTITYKVCSKIRKIVQ